LKELLLRTITGISLIILVAGSILLGPVPFLGFIVLVYVLSLKELFTLYKVKMILPIGLLVVSTLLIFPVTYLFMQFHVSPLWYIIPTSGWALAAIWSRFNTCSRLAFFWLALPLGTFYAMGWMNAANSYQPLLPLSIIALVWLNDTFAFVTGRLIGKHPLTPVLSPGKTWEGLIGGITFTFLGGWILFRITGEWNLGIWFSIAFFVGSLGLTGDLFESHLKRKRSVKNMGGILPGHGGVLDRFDSLLFVAPAIFILLIIYTFLT